MVALKRHADLVEGKLVVDESRPNLGLLSSWSIINSGSCASLTAPNGPVMQQAVADCVRHASLSPLDVDAVECDGKGALFFDAVELTCISRVLRGLEGGDKEVLSFTSSKPKMGFTQETAGVASLISVLVTQRHGICSGNIHLRELNPHADMEYAATQVGNEPHSYRCRSSFHGVSAYGFGGTNVHVLLWAEMDDFKHPVVRVELDRQVFTFWPGGGGEIEDAAKPQKGYSIIGSWSSWEFPERMRPEGEGAFGFTVSLGDNRFEQFQIWVDGDSQRVLHPGRSGAPLGAPIHGPAPLDTCQGSNWLVDGRPLLVPVPAIAWAARPGAGEGEKRPDVEAIDKEEVRLVPVGGRGVGLPGDQYHIRLQVAGKWRAVTWERLAGAEEVGGASASAAIRGRYFVAGSWSNWSFVSMEPEEPVPGLWRLDVRLDEPGGLFQIVRNKDWSQAFYPADEEASFGRGGGAVAGPDSAGHGMNWFLDGLRGDVFRIEFQRLVDGETESRTVSWRRLGDALEDG